MMNQKSTFFSIIIPTYNRPKQLSACLRSVSGLNYPRDRFETIVVIDGGNSSMAGITEAFGNQFDITVIRQAHAGPATARNTGAAKARGEYLAFTDDDCRPDPFWLQNLAIRFAGSPNTLVGGRTLNALPGNTFSATSQMLIDYLYSYYNADPEDARFLTSNNLSLPAESFHALNGFDTTFIRAGGEDREFCDRWIHQGRKIKCAPKALVYHLHALSLHTFWRQHFHYGRGAFCFYRSRENRSMKLEPRAFYVNLMYYPLRQSKGLRPLLSATLMAVSQLANALGYYWEHTISK